MSKTNKDQKAQSLLSSTLVGYMRHGINHRLKWFDAQEPDSAEPIAMKHPPFNPDGTRIRVATFGDGDVIQTLEVYEIVNTHPITEDRINSIERFSIVLYDLREIFLELWVCDNDGERLGMKFDSRTTLHDYNKEIEKDAQISFV